ncbi:hypothetical protein LMF32_00800 [Desemzia sp. C1]|uniref:hypothetical protein n=1 Tax=Desemzia sp. C1 TaxID=2892016 RepID=UPI001E361A92|nr:hypothetical protein [Desemzia sp. C1]MCI3027674.1 hypothetical protein [Desemzia sp. C1]
MIINNVTDGRKIPYTTNGNKIFFNDEMMLNLEKYERDYEISIDICEDENFMLVNGLGRRYVAQIKIPERKYKQVNAEQESNEDGDIGEAEPQYDVVPVPFDINKCTLNLWGLD